MTGVVSDMGGFTAIYDGPGLRPAAFLLLESCRDRIIGRQMDARALDGR